METTKITLLAIAAIFITACDTSKKSAASTAATTAPTSTSTIPFYLATPGIFAPGDKELAAMTQYKDVTLALLKEGHAIYTTGACIGCHTAQNIYNYEEAKWKDIVEDMALKANISDEQKNAVYKYVLAIKATQPK